MRPLIFLNIVTFIDLSPLAKITAVVVVMR